MINLAIKKVLDLLFLPFLYVGYLISGLVPRDCSLWVFGSWNGKRFADNSKWFFLHCIQNPTPGYRYIWISRNKPLIRKMAAEGYMVVYLYSIAGLYYAVRAGVYIFDSYSRDISFWTSFGAKKVFLMHGVPIKKIGRDIDNSNNWFYKCYHGNIFEKIVYGLLQPWWIEKYDLIPSTSQYTATIYQSAFGVNVMQTPITGFSRNDILQNRENRLPINWSEFELSLVNYSNIIIYMPTFRDSDRDDRKIPIDLDRLEDLFRSHNSLFLLKLHPNERFGLSTGQYSHIKTLDADLDVYPLFQRTSLLITDYSSVSLDFMTTDRPVVFYTYDIEEYVKKERSLYIDIEEVIQGQPEARNFEELLELLSDFFDGKEMGGSVQDLSKRFHSYADGRSSERIKAAIETM